MERRFNMHAGFNFTDRARINFRNLSQPEEKPARVETVSSVTSTTVDSNQTDIERMVYESGPSQAISSSFSVREALNGSIATNGQEISTVSPESAQFVK